MKVKSVLSIVTLLVLVVSFTACSVNDSIVNNEQQDIMIIMQGKEKVLSSEDGERIKPILHNNMVYVPAKEFSELFGKRYAWDNSDNTVQIYDEKFNNEDVDQGKQTIIEFFDFYQRHEFYEMKLLSTGETSAWDFRSSVFGMKEAELVDCNIDEKSYNNGYGILAYKCTFEMNAAEGSVYPSDQTKLSCYVIVEKIDSKYMISNFVTGL